MLAMSSSIENKYINHYQFIHRAFSSNITTYICYVKYLTFISVDTLFCTSLRLLPLQFGKLPQIKCKYRQYPKQTMIYISL